MKERWFINGNEVSKFVYDTHMRPTLPQFNTKDTNDLSDEIYKLNLEDEIDSQLFDEYWDIGPKVQWKPESKVIKSPDGYYTVDPSYPTIKSEKKDDRYHEKEYEAFRNM